MRNRLPALFLCTVLILTGLKGVSGQEDSTYSTAELLNDCGYYMLINSEPQHAHPISRSASERCQGFVQKVVSSIDHRHPSPPPVCLPDPVNFDLLILLTMQYMDTSSPPPTQPAITTLLAALGSVYACKHR